MRSYFLNWIHGISFKNRIRTAFMCLLIFAVASTGGVSYYIVAGVIERQALKQSQDSLNKSAQVLDERLRKILVYMMTITISQPFKDLVVDLSEQDSRNYYKHLSNLQPIFDQFTLNEHSVGSVLISTSIGDFYSTTQRRLTEHPFQQTELYRQMTSSTANQRVYWSEEHKDELFSDGKSVISLVFQPFTQNLSVKDIYIIVNVDAPTIFKLVDSTFDELDRESFILAGGKSSVFKRQGSYWDLLQSGGLFERIGKETEDFFVFSHNDKEMYLINYAKLQVYSDWTLFTVQPRSKLLRLIDGIRWSSIAIVIVCAILTLYITNVLTGILFKPLMKMQFLMNRVGQNNLHLRFHSPYQDELAQMGEKFNQMLDEIMALMEQNTQMEKDKHVAEVKALQAQINPHFLYNSLNMVFLKCMDNQYDKAKEMVISLSRLFELGLNKGLEGTTVEQELHHVEYYMKIQMACYRDLFDYRIHVQDKSLLAYPMLKILLQPLVENSILHGFKNQTTGGEIDIFVEREHDFIVLTVQDNGSGMDPQAVKRTIHDKSADSYALRNVYNRLKLYGGDRAQMSITSIPGATTRIQLFIPIRADGGERN
ncbi:sensor histidine kinase [Paenibacillus thalictri]|uniref:Sensor histidine kinase n=1 Tax=Paenibacillus thalictri TaxID=2527873 RepID=A0A4Q9DPM1_9BACL|nr:sensor histidine kinase [Paenibacillus thalictri]TBL76588.1 sensor histidine kinase [Paenibacillus thalictri]